MRTRFCNGYRSTMPEISIPRPPLTDGVVTLRLWRAADVPQRLAGYTDPQFERFSLPSAGELTEARVRAQLEHDERERLLGTKVGLAIVDAADDDRVWGGCSLYDIDLEHRRAGVGYWLAAHARGRGAATRTVGLLAQWAFAGLGLARLELTCSPENIASQRVAERAGFVREGILRSHIRFGDERRDSVLFSLLPEDSRGTE
ncbi:RimJ/RimL family protein N-acetyltransferase [Nocardia tenerifensis]|uniref:RimJ/RimL family protein N-acetyltransferase n=2 Tax=Nocardia tenerifensis TaxID=228006 RepID=A0A318KAL2_9NOCA|nr:RimJ/RimL family protein N-acetyltransferase [Nocardia tenerifensis]